MKKLLSIVLCLCLLLGLTACGTAKTEQTQAAGQTPAPTEEKVKEAFRVGYHKINVTPDAPTPLYGYGNPGERLHTEVMDPLYITCVAISDAEDNTVMFITIDLCSLDQNTVSSMRGKISAETGVPKGNIHISITHTHSAPQASAIANQLIGCSAELGAEAMADRKYATMYISKGETEGINFIRHYFMEDGSSVGDNHGNPTGKKYAGHASEVDEEMRVIHFVREGGKDVVLANWQSHPHITGGSLKTSMSADIIGMFRNEMEKGGEYLFAYYQGGAGNINPTSRIREEEANPSHDYKIHGQVLASTCKIAMQSETEVAYGPILVKNSTFESESNKEEMDKVQYASLVIEYYKDGHTFAETQLYAQENYGIQSYYHASAISNRGGYDKTITVEVNAIVIGEVAWVTAPFEVFDVNAKFVRDNSPYTMTFYNGYCNGGNGYIPSLEAWEYGCYEADTAKFARGSAEKLSDTLVGLLNELHG